MSGFFLSNSTSRWGQNAWLGARPRKTREWVNFLEIKTVVARVLLLTTFFLMWLLNGCQRKGVLHHYQEARTLSAENTALHKMIANGSVSEVLDALEAGADLNAPDD